MLTKLGKFISEQPLTLAKVTPKSQKIVVTGTGWPCKFIPALKFHEVDLHVQEGSIVLEPVLLLECFLFLWELQTESTNSRTIGKGANNKVAVPSLANQAKALASIQDVFQTKKSSVILFTIYNDRWKQNTAATFDADEQYWGIKGVDAPSG